MKQNNTNNLPHGNYELPAKILMTIYLGEALPIDGGWGYDKDDAVVITTDNSTVGIRLEYKFFETRARIDSLELEGLSYDDFQFLGQSLKIIDGIHYDVLTAEVTMCDDDDNETKYHTECWFNVDKIFEGYSKEIT